MNDTKPKIKFYSMGSQKIDFSKILNGVNLDASKPVTISSGFNNALRSVIDKDIDFLSDKVKKIINDIKKLLVVNNINYEINGTISEMDTLINEVETTISKVIIEKENIKVGLFSTRKKEKKEKCKKLEECVNMLSKYQTELISIKDEYNKLLKRKSVLQDALPAEENDAEPEDPLERTINFYMKKQGN